MTNSLRWGIAGTGAMAAQFVRDLGSVPGATVRGVASRDPVRAGVFAREHDIATTHTSHAGLMADPSIDIVYIATEHTLHHDLAMRSLAAGKHVLVEKPLACTAARARDIAAMAHARRRFCMEGMWLRFLPSVQRARDLLATGSLGRATAFTAELGWPHTVDPSSRLFDPKRGGGAMLELGVYSISLAIWLFGSASLLHGSAARTETGVDGSVTATLRHADGRLSTHRLSLVDQTSNQAVVVAEQGRVVLDATTLRQGFSVEHWSERGRQRSERHHLPAAGLGYVDEAIAVTACIARGWLESPVMPLAESIAVLEICDSLRALAR
jgi:predicted dehydrogenase